MSAGTGLHPRRWGAELFASLHHYSRSWLGGDTVAGLTVWALLVPEAPLRVHTTVRSAPEAAEAELAQRHGGENVAADA